MLVAFAAAVLLLAQAGPAAPAPPAAAAKPAAPEKPKQICRTEIQTGSKFSKRMCLTADEWKAMEASARDQSEAMRACRSGMGC